MNQTLTKSLNPLEDVPAFQEHQYILQARKFIQSGADPLNYYAAVAQSLPTLKGTVEAQTALNLLEDIEMALINLVFDKLNAGAIERKNGNTKAEKPVELYRKYAPALRAIMQRGGEFAYLAQDVLTEVYLEQTQSNGDLETPDYQDSYTQEIEWRSIDDIVSEERHANGFKDLLRAIMWDREADGFDGTAPVLPVSGWNWEI
jgi:hypothetical protein